MTKIDLSNTWSGTLIFAVALTVAFVRPSVSTLKTCWSDIREKGLWTGARMSFRRLRWFFIGALLCFTLSHLLHVGLYRTFNSVTVTDTKLLIDYPWPRRDFAVPWNEVQEIRVDSNQRIKRRGNRLRIETLHARHVTPWLRGRMVLQAKRLIEAQISRDKEQSNDPPLPSSP